MANIFFRNSANWTQVYAVFFAPDGTKSELVRLENLDADEDYCVEFDPEKYESLMFAGTCEKEPDKEKETSKIFPGKLSLGVEYKWNESQNKYLTYLFKKEETEKGRVDTFVLADEQNLSYRQDKSKKIHVFVPSYYKEEEPSEILYFFDAQNLFAKALQYTDKNDPYGGWQLDVILDAIYRQYGRNILVVGMENADAYRELELFMNPKEFGQLAPLATDIPDEVFVEGHLDELSAFMMQTVHPFIKKKYNVDETHMGIGGSSMGGIAAFYCAMKDLGFFDYVLSYSPAYALYEMSAFENFFGKLFFENRADRLPKLHIYCGEGDELEKQLILSARKMKDTLTKHGYKKDLVCETYDLQKVHNEEAWRLVLGESFTKLLGL